MTDKYDRYAYLTIAAVRRANKLAGQFFFSPDTMRFFSSRIGRTVYGGRYFVTSEQGPSEVRRYTVREAMENGHVGNAPGSDFQAFGTSRSAQAWARRLVRERR